MANAQVEVEVTCPDCGGAKSVKVDCSSCQGTGEKQIGDPPFITTETCQACDGTGSRYVTCSTCGGLGKVILV